MISENIFVLEMALLKYLKLKQRNTMKTCSECLPDTSDPLVITMPSGSISATNWSVAKVLEKQQWQAETKKLCGEYRIYTAKERAEIGKTATIYGINSMIKYYKKINPERPLPSSSVLTWN